MEDGPRKLPYPIIMALFISQKLLQFFLEGCIFWSIPWTSNQYYGLSKASYMNKGFVENPSIKSENICMVQIRSENQQNCQDL